MIKDLFLSIILLTLTFTVKAQSHPGIDAFTKFVSKNYRLPEELKSNCEWMYTIVKVKTDSHNKIVKYEFANTPPEGMKKTFNYLIGYRFPKKMKINGHPIVFYMAIDNLEGCTEKPGDKMFYTPNDAASTIWLQMSKVLTDDPKTIFIPGVLYYGYGKAQP